MRPLALVPFLAACTRGPATSDGSLPDFALDDVNPNSVTFTRTVDVAEYQGVATAWYFTHAT